MISLLAFGVSGATFYFNFVRIIDQLALTPLRVVDLESQSTRLANQALEVAIHNVGNRDAAFIDAYPACWNYGQESWTIYAISLKGNAPTVLHPRDIKIIQIPIPAECTRQSRQADATSFEELTMPPIFVATLGLKVMTLDSRGNTFSSLFPVGKVDPTETTLVSGLVPLLRNTQAKPQTGK